MTSLVSFSKGNISSISTSDVNYSPDSFTSFTEDANNIISLIGEYLGDHNRDLQNHIISYLIPSQEDFELIEKEEFQDDYLEVEIDNQVLEDMEVPSSGSFDLGTLGFSLEDLSESDSESDLPRDENQILTPRFSKQQQIEGLKVRENLIATLSDKKEICKALHAIALEYIELEEFESALNAFIEENANAVLINDKTDNCLMLIQVAYGYHKIDELAMALGTLQAVSEIARSIEDENGKSSILSIFDKAHSEMGFEV